MAFVAILSQPWPRNWKWFHMVLFLGWLFSTHSAFGVLWLVQVRGFVGWGSGNPGNIVLLIWRFLKGSGMVGQIVGLVTDTRLVSGNVWNPLCSIRHLHNISNPKRSWIQPIRISVMTCCCASRFPNEPPWMPCQPGMTCVREPVHASDVPTN